MALGRDVENVVFGALGIVIIVLIVWMVLAIKKVKIPGLPDLAELLDNLWSKILSALSPDANGAGGDIGGDEFGSEDFQIRTGIER